MREIVIVIGKTQAQLCEEAARQGITLVELVAQLPKDQVQRFPQPESDEE